MQPQVVTPGVAARSGRFAGWKVAAGVLVLAAVAGAAIVLQVRGWSAVEGESGRACGSGSAACPRATVPVLVVSFVAGLAAIPLVIAAVVRRPKVNAVIAAVGLAAGVLAAQPLSGWLNGTQLRVDWTSPYDASATLTTEGVWTTGGSLIRVRADEIVSYDAATGRQQWTLPVPAGDAACAVSAETAAGAGLIGFGAAGGACDHVLAVDLGTGRQLWSRQVAAGWKGDQGTGFVAVGGDTAVLVTAGGVLGYDLRTGAPRWTLLVPGGCSGQTVAAAPPSGVMLAACGQDFDVIDFDLASGRQLWSTPVAEPAPDYQFAILSAAPVVVSDVLPGTPSADHVRVFGAGGTVVSTIPAGGLDTSSYQGFGPEVVVSGGLLVGVTPASGGHAGVVAYRLSDGRRRWQVRMPDGVLGVRPDGGQLLVIDQSAPAPALDEIALASGTLHAIGLVPRGVVGASGTGVYPAGGRYLMVNLTGRAPVPPVAALSGLPASAVEPEAGRRPCEVPSSQVQSPTESGGSQMSTPSADWTPMPDPAAGGVTSPPFLANLTADERAHLVTFDALDFEVFSNQDWARLSESHASNIRVHYPDGHYTDGIDRHIADMAAWFEWAPDLTAVMGVLKGTFSKPMPDGKGGTIAPTGKAFAVDMITVGIWNRSGTMDEEFLFWDNQTFYGEMGLG